MSSVLDIMCPRSLSDPDKQVVGYLSLEFGREV